MQASAARTCRHLQDAVWCRTSLSLNHGASVSAPWLAYDPIRGFSCPLRTLSLGTARNEVTEILTRPSHSHCLGGKKKRHRAPKDATLVDEKGSDGSGGDVTGVAVAMIILPPSEPAKLPVTLPEYQSCCATANRTRQAATAQLVASGSCTPRHLPRPITHGDIADDAGLQSQARNQHYRVQYTQSVITSTLALRLSSQQRRAVSERVHALRPPTPFPFRALRAVLSCLLMLRRSHGAAGAGGSE